MQNTMILEEISGQVIEFIKAVRKRMKAVKLFEDKYGGERKRG